LTITFEFVDTDDEDFVVENDVFESIVVVVGLEIDCGFDVVVVVVVVVVGEADVVVVVVVVGVVVVVAVVVVVVVFNGTLERHVWYVSSLASQFIQLVQVSFCYQPINF
jgi:hypothetical protein